MGEDADNVLTSTNITKADRKKYETVVSKFDEFFQVRRNVIYERARFNRRDQRDGESAEQYITVLYELVKNCNYGEFRDDLLRDRLVVGIKDTALSEKLQMDAKLTLEDAKKIIRQKEAVREQHLQLQADGSRDKPIVIDQVHSSRLQARPGRATRVAFNKPQTSYNTSEASPRCTRCGGHRHFGGEKCPAKGAICNKCNRRGHYQAVCFSKTVASVTTDLGMDIAFLGSVNATQKTSWSTTLRLGTKDVFFKLDIGAEVTAISDSLHKSLGGIKLEKPSKILYGPAHQTLAVLGQFTGTLSYKNKSVSQTVFVVRGLKCNLLGFPAITSLQLLSRVDAAHAETEDQDFRKLFADLFSGLGNLGEEYEIKLKEGAVPYSLFTARNVPIPLRQKVHD